MINNYWGEGPESEDELDDDDLYDNTYPYWFEDNDVNSYPEFP